MAAASVTVLAEWEGPQTLGKGSSLTSLAASGPGALWFDLPVACPHLLVTFPFFIDMGVSVGWDPVVPFCLFHYLCREPVSRKVTLGSRASA